MQWPNDALWCGRGWKKHRARPQRRLFLTSNLIVSPVLRVRGVLRVSSILWNHQSHPSVCSFSQSMILPVQREREHIWLSGYWNTLCVLSHVDKLLTSEETTRCKCVTGRVNDSFLLPLMKDGKKCKDQHSRFSNDGPAECLANRSYRGRGGRKKLY